MLERNNDESLKYVLWLNHAHSGMYGDDGEMQCQSCRSEYGFWDWKNTPMAEILWRVFGYGEAPKTKEPNTLTMPTELTAENGAKATLIGEFTIPIEILCPECSGGMDEECDLCAGSGLRISHNINVPWTTIKDIYAKAVSHFGVEVKG